MLAGLFLMTSCEKQLELDLNKSITANAGPDQAVQVGQVVTLDGSGSSDSQGKPLTYGWSLVRQPATSAAKITDASTANPTFKPDETGEYELELTVTSSNGKATDKVLIKASMSEPLVISENITEKTTLVDRLANPDLPDYIVTKSIDVNSELTIKPGVVIAFERDVYMNIQDSGYLIAKGQSDKKIKFVGVQKTKGYWAGIALYSGSNLNIMEHVEIMHTGSRPVHSDIKAALLVYGGSESQITIKNSQFSQNDGYGMYVYEGAILLEFSQNSFTNNTEAGIMVDAMNVSRLDAASKFTGGNGRNVVEILESSLEGNKEIEWKAFADKTPYRLNGELTVNSGWKLNPGVTLEMNRDALIEISNDGYMSAQGTATEKVVFTSANRTAAYWRGIACYSQVNKNILQHAEVKNAGSKTLVSDKKSNIAIYGDGTSMTIKNTLISGSGGYGVFVGLGASANTDLSSANTFEANAQTNVLIEE
jgi:PKD repeat protein